MSGIYGAPGTLTLPTVSSTIGPTYATQINAAIQQLYDILAARVTPTGMSISLDLSFGGFLAYHLGGTRYDDQTGSPGSRTLYFNAGELYVTDGVGNNIKLTSGGVINAASIGGFTGDYGAPGITGDAQYNDASKEFRFFQSSGVYALVACADLKIREAVAAANAVTIKSPAGLAGAYSLTLPTALPGASGTLLQASNTGALSFSNSIASLTTTSGAVTSFSDLKHGNVTRQLAGSSAVPFGTEWTWNYPTAASAYWLGNAATGHLTMAVDLLVGDRIKSVSVYITDSANAVQFKLWQQTSAGVTTQLGATQTSTASSTAQTLTVTNTYTILAGDQIYIEILAGAANFATQRFRGGSVVYDRP